MEQAGRQKLHRREPEARVMCCEERKRLGYNGQAVADSQAGIIVGAEVTAQENDTAQLEPMVKQAMENTGRVPPEVVADSGYAVGDQIQRTQALGTNVITPSPTPHKDQQPYHVSHFEYDAIQNQVTCPRGEKLDFQYATVKADRGPVRIYRCKNRDCPVRRQCSKDPKGRMMEIGPWTEVLQRQRQKLLDPRLKGILRKRGTIIEPVFARIKERWGFRRWLYRGLGKVRSQWALLCLVSNLSIMWHRKMRAMG
jgi:hypothetical protein